MLNIIDRQKEERIPPILRLGFRPFFLLGSAYSAVAVAVWLWIFTHGQPESLAVPGLWWHVHEMFFGFAMAIVAGFLMTAVQNWTGVKGTSGLRLAMIVVLWHCRGYCCGHRRHFGSHRLLMRSFSSWLVGKLAAAL